MPDYLAWWLWFGFWFSGVWMVKTIASCYLTLRIAQADRDIYESKLRAEDATVRIRNCRFACVPYGIEMSPSTFVIRGVVWHSQRPD